MATALKSFLGRLRKRAQPGHVLIGLFLVLAFAATSVVLLFVITAERLQDSIATTDLGNTKTSIGAIRQDVAQVEHYYTVLAAFSRKQVETEEALFQAHINRQAALIKLITTTAHIRSLINLHETEAIIPPLKLHAFQETPNLSTTERALAFDTAVTGYFASYYDALNDSTAANAERARAALDGFKATIYAGLQTYTGELAAYTAADSALQSLQAQAAALQKSKKAFDDSVGAAGTSLANDSYWDLCEDFYSFKTLVGDAAYKIVLLPKMMLILTLSIFMGVLGSLICISRDFLKNPDERSFGEILFRIGLGAGVAFALFFFAAAGMLAFAQETAAQGSQPGLSPYLISFLGITAGYLSDRVAEWMREMGIKAFKLETEAEPDRWGIGLNSEVAAQAIPHSTLAKALGVSPDDVDGWCAVTKPVPAASQKALALYLHTDRCRLFSDLEPMRG